jgi:hypothetical protein
MGGEDQGRGIGFSIVRLQIATHHTVPVRFVERISHLRSVFQHLIGCDDFVRTQACAGSERHGHPNGRRLYLLCKSTPSSMRAITHRPDFSNPSRMTSAVSSANASPRVSAGVNQRTSSASSAACASPPTRQQRKSTSTK